MKLLLSILLLITTSLYILPAKEIFKNTASICMTDVDDEKGESDKKEKVKDFFSFAEYYTHYSDAYCCTQHTAPFNLQALLHLVETPPPDFN
jgi:hypothetical protein